MQFHYSFLLICYLFILKQNIYSLWDLESPILFDLPS